jgi:hypothetical protein
MDVNGNQTGKKAEAAPAKTKAPANKKPVTITDLIIKMMLRISKGLKEKL